MSEALKDYVIGLTKEESNEQTSDESNDKAEEVECGK